jgi:hypothetical protein
MPWYSLKIKKYGTGELGCLLCGVASMLAVLAPVAGFSQALRIPGFPRALPNPLILNDGSPVVSPRQWDTLRRKELLQLFTTQEYGRSPARPPHMSFRVFDNDPHALGGTATRRQIAVFPAGKTGPRIDILLYLPHVKGPVPVFLGLNFAGNQTIISDTAIRITASWEYGGNKGVVDHRATAASRGTAAERWPVAMILEHGYGIATVYAGDIAPDHKDGDTAGVQALYPSFRQGGDNFGVLSAWAWGLSRVMDYFQTDKDVDARRVAVFGWSRMGKAALWAGAQDSRFAMVISNESGAGGAKLFHEFPGENIRRLCTHFPYWFCRNFRRYVGRDTVLAFDQHELVSLIAPRPVYIASAEDDSNSDPYAEFLTALAADTVYRFLGAGGLPVKAMPPVNHPVFGRISYHVRSGGHNITPYDWRQYLHFADLYLRPGSRRAPE